MPEWIHWSQLAAKRSNTLLSFVTWFCSTGVCVCVYVCQPWCASQSLICSPLLFTSWNPFPHQPRPIKGSSENRKKKKPHYSLCSPSLAWRVQAKLQLTNACQWPADCRQGSSTEPRWERFQCPVLCVCPGVSANVLFRFGLCFGFVLLLLSGHFSGYFKTFVRLCVVIKPEMSPSHSTTWGRQSEKNKKMSENNSSFKEGCWTE